MGEPVSAPMYFFFAQVGEYQPLPVSIEIVRAALARKPQTRPALEGFEPQVYFGVMAQRFVMSVAVDLLRKRFLVSDAALAEIYVDVKAAL